VVQDYRDQLKAGVERPILDPAKFSDLDIDQTAWDRSRWPEVAKLDK
jgi:AGCS family alanine or glycine:cation symporter